MRKYVGTFLAGWLLASLVIGTIGHDAIAGWAYYGGLGALVLAAVVATTYDNGKRAATREDHQ